MNVNCLLYRLNAGGFKTGVRRRLPQLLTLYAMSLFGATTSDSWLITLQPHRGAITASTTRGDLVGRYGTANVRDQNVDVGEGETEPGTILFPQDPYRTIAILWKDPETKLAPSAVILSGSASRWKADHGISLGTSLRDIEHINGRPFVIAGFGWDYGGTVLSWEDGVLSDLEKNGRAVLRLGPDARSDTSRVQGDRPIPSVNPTMQKINPKVYEIQWVFP